MESKIIKRFVVLLQSDGSTNENKYLKLLNEANINAKSVSTLSFNFINENKLKKCLVNDDEYGGMIFSSTRAVSAVSKVLNSCTDLCVTKWKQKCNFSIGKATSALATSLLNFETFGSESGNSENLCHCIIEKYGKCSKPLLFPCSNIRKDTIPDILSANGISLEEVICYETVPNVEFQTLWKDIVLNEGLPEIVIFFSPSGVQFGGKIIMDTYSEVSRPKYIAIGPSTEKALLEANMVPCKMAQKPNPECVLSAIQDFLET